MIGNILENTLLKPQAAQKAGSQAMDSSRSQFEDLMRVSSDRVELTGKSKQEQIEHLANQFVSVAFIQPMMDKMRNSPFKSEMFSGGAGGDMFQGHLDTILADRISQGANLPIARMLYERLSGQEKATHPSAVPEVDSDEAAKPAKGTDQNG